MKLVLNLTDQEAEKLMDALNDYQDCGPYGEGWKSGVLGELIAKVEDAEAGEIPLDTDDDQLLLIAGAHINAEGYLIPPGPGLTEVERIAWHAMAQLLRERRLTELVEFREQYSGHNQVFAQHTRLTADARARLAAQWARFGLVKPLPDLAGQNPA